ncbi:MerR family transcriptional regulator [Kitasatospora sp. NA04385]|uniref:MerR family transcriptional regulator n=1 Tax=Kitasatospora sp. NA04385 TaxID=2742135 RepID=UPI001591ECEC|nr:MerR family transcriptional regulator [Kitasatospora sp. NA04385]QKW18060.1 MerR family transcriptional regulator [Kitasatospora sp. NA04385]
MRTTTPADPGLPTGAVARLLGVSPVTVRSWERRYGIGPTSHEPGRHRRWHAEDVAVLEAMCRLTSRGLPPGEAARAARAALADSLADGPDRAPRPDDAPGPAPEPAAAPVAPHRRPDPRPPAAGPQPSTGPRPSAEPRPTSRGLAAAALRLDAPEVARLLGEAVDALGTVCAWTEVMAPALRAAGRRWAADGEQYVEVEHLLSWQVSSVLRAVALRPAVPVRAVPPLLLAAMPGEQHSLPLEAVAAGAAERGLPFRMLGAAVPARALLDAQRRLGPSAVLLWSQTAHTADQRLVCLLAGAAWGQRGARTASAVLAAGPGWGPTGPSAARAVPRSLAAALDLMARTALR